MSGFIDQFVRNLVANVVGGDLVPDAVDGPPIVKLHTNRVSTGGDLSFPVTAQRWAHFLRGGTRGLPDETIFQLAQSGEKNTDEYIQQMAVDLQSSVSRIRLAEERVLIFLRRPFVFETLLSVLGQGNDYGKEEKGADWVMVVPGQCFEEVEESQLNVTEYRCQLIRDVLINLIGYSRYQLGSPPSKKPLVELSVSYKSCPKANEVGRTNILCGVVCDGSGQFSHKMSSITTAEYISIRRSHMEQIVQEKYKHGVRIEDQQMLAEMSKQLGMATVTVDLMEVKHSSPIALSIANHCGGASRGASFILYNSARIDKLIRTYDQNIASGHYSAPNEMAYDWSLLKEEDEWMLMFNYILEFPRVVRRALGEVATGSIGGPHLICSFLNGLVRCFSVYYRRVRILDYNRKHLMPILHCRMKLVFAVQNVLHQALALLNIQPIQNM